MAEETPNVEAQVAEDTTSQADTTTEQPTAADSAKEEFVPKSELNKKNAENKSLRTRMNTAEAELEKIRNAELSESERLKKDLDETAGRVTQYESTVKNLLLRQKVTAAAVANGARPTALRAIEKLIEADNLEFDLEKLDVNGVEEEIKRLKKEDPDLFITGGTNGGAGNSNAGRPLSNMNDLIRGSARR